MNEIRIQNQNIESRISEKKFQNQGGEMNEIRIQHSESRIQSTLEEIGGEEEGNFRKSKGEGNGRNEIRISEFRIPALHAFPFCLR